MKRKWTSLLAFLLAILMAVSVFPMTGIALGIEDEPPQTEGAMEEVSLQEIEILGEDESSRTENSKRFQLRDGSYSVVMYETPIHYEENGEWIDIDNSLVEKEVHEVVVSEPEQQLEPETTQPQREESADLTEEAVDAGPTEEPTDIGIQSVAAQAHPGRQTRTVRRNVLQTRSNEQSVRFARSTEDEQLISVGEQSEQVSWGYRDMNRSEAKIIKPKEKHQGNDQFTALQNLNGEAYYKNVYKNVDMQAIVTPVGIKENFILKKKNAQTSFTVEYDLNGLIAEQSGDQSIYLKDDAGELRYIITAPYMTDAKGEASADVKLLIISQESDRMVAELSVDDSWVKAKERKFPIVLDPYFVVNRDWDTVDSCYIASGTPNASYGRGGNSYEGSMYVGRHTDRGKKRSLIKINTLPAMNKGDIVISAYMSVSQVRDDATMQVNLHEATKSWKENSVTWNSNITYNSTVVDYISVKPNSGNQRTWDITDLVIGWYGGKANNGMLLRSPAEDGNIVMQSWYLSGSYPSNQSVRPLFQIVYRNNKGLEPYWDYSSFDVGDAGTAYINNYTGHLVFTRTESGSNGLKSPAAISRIYNGYMAGDRFGDAKNPGPIPRVGRGWKLNIQQSVVSSSKFNLTGEALKQYPYAYTDSDGTVHFFMKTSSGTLEDEDGLKLKLTDNGTGNAKYKITDDDKTVMEFDTNGNLRRIIDANKNEIKINYKSNSTMIQSVTDGAGNIIRLEEHPTNGSGYMTRIYDPANRSTYFYHDDGGYLTYLIEPDGSRVNFTYDSSGRMTSAQASDGFKIAFSYSSAASGSRVIAIQEYTSDGTAGQKIEFDYSKAYTTTVRDSGLDGVFKNADDVQTIYQFDQYGRTTGIYSKTDNRDLGAAGFQYTAGVPNSSGSNIRQLNRISQEHTVGSNVPNLLRNHSFELAAHWGTAAWNGTAAFSAAMSTDQKYLGAKSMKINVTSHDNDAAGRVYEDLTLTPGKTYTVSGYVKTSNITSTRTSGVGAVIFTDSFNADGGFTKTYTEYLMGTTDTAIDNGWRRVSSTFTVPANSTKVRINLAVRGAKGTAWFDALQVEEGNMVNPYNMLENPEFEEDAEYTQVPRGWTGTNLTSGQDLVAITHLTGKHSYRMIGDAAKNKYLRQEITVSGTEDDTYILSGWALANAVPGGDPYTRKFQMSIAVNYTDGTTVWKTPAYFNHSIRAWQYTSTAFNLSSGASTKKTPKSIAIYLVYYQQQNNAYFDNIMLIKDVTQSYTYDSDGNLISVKDASEKNKIEYKNSNLIGITDIKGHKYKYDYDENNNLTKATSQNGITTNYTYDEHGIPIELEIKDADNSMSIKSQNELTANGNFVKNTYDAHGRMTSVDVDEKTGNILSETNESGTYINEYNNAQTLLMKVSHRRDNGDIISNSYTYDTNKRLTALTNGKTTYNLTYDRFGNPSEVRIGNQPLVTYAFGANNGIVNKQIFGNGDNSEYKYDDFGNVISVSYNGSVASQWKTDRRGALVMETDFANQLATNIISDSLGRLSQRIVKDKQSAGGSDRALYMVEYGYDIDDNLSRVATSAGEKSFVEKFTYGKDNLAEQYLFNDSHSISYEYDALNRLIGTKFNTEQPLETSMTYAASARNEDGSSYYQTTRLETETINGITYRYQYDDFGRVIKTEKSIDGNNYILHKQYIYNDLGQMTDEISLDGSNSFHFTYDESGNILSKDIRKSGTEMTEQYEYADLNWPDKLTKYSGQTITYDEIGNPLQYRNGIQMTWTNGRQLASLQNGSDTVSYSYDSAGTRLRKNVNDTEYFYQYLHSRISYEQRGDTMFRYFYDSYGNPAVLYLLQNNIESFYYYACNNDGDVLSIHDVTGTPIVSYQYDAWGNIEAMLDANGNDIQDDMNHIGNLNPLRYRGYYFDEESGFYYLQSRYYDPQIGRFINADMFASTGQGLLGLNMFVYCGNNPIQRVDPNGTMHLPSKAAADAYKEGLRKLSVAKSTAAKVSYLNNQYKPSSSGSKGNIVYSQSKTLLESSYSTWWNPVKLKTTSSSTLILKDAMNTSSKLLINLNYDNFAHSIGAKINIGQNGGYLKGKYTTQGVEISASTNGESAWGIYGTSKLEIGVFVEKTTDLGDGLTTTTSSYYGVNLGQFYLTITALGVVAGAVILGGPVIAGVVASAGGSIGTAIWVLYQILSRSPAIA